MFKCDGMSVLAWGGHASVGAHVEVQGGQQDGGGDGVVVGLRGLVVDMVVEDGARLCRVALPAPHGTRAFQQADLAVLCSRKVSRVGDAITVGVQYEVRNYV